MPDEIESNDLKKIYDVRIELRADNPLAAAQKARDGDFKYQNFIIDLKTNLIKYQGMTQEEAADIMTNLLVDAVMRNNPIINEVMGMDAAEEIGIEDKYTALLEARKQGGKQMGGLSPESKIGSEGGQPRINNIQTPQGEEELDLGRIRPTRGQPNV